MRIVYFGSHTTGSTSYHRAKALERIGCEVELIDIYSLLPKHVTSGLMSKIHFRSGYSLLQYSIRRFVSRAIESLSAKVDLVWIDSGELFGPDIVDMLRRKFGTKILVLNLDDPTGPRDGLRFLQLRRALPRYDLAVTVRSETEQELLSLGVGSVLRVFRSYDEIAHRPFCDSSQIPNQFKSEVSFVGTWMRRENRDWFILELIQSGIQVAIWGSRWERSPLYKRLASSVRGGALSGREYVSAIQGSSISLGMLSKGNRDLHTTRSAEIPYAGGLLCAERTTEHLQMYRENVDAVFWSDAKECAEVCKDLLKDDRRRNLIRVSGMERVRGLRIGNEDVCRKILEHVRAIAP